MIARALAGILALLAFAGLVWAGIGFAAYALASFLSDYLGWPAAAAITGAVSLLLPVGTILLISSRIAAARRRRQANSLLAMIARVAAEQPVLAMVSAALLGVVEALVGARRQRNKP